MQTGKTRLGLTHLTPDSPTTSMVLSAGAASAAVAAERASDARPSLRGRGTILAAEVSPLCAALLQLCARQPTSRGESRVASGACVRACVCGARVGRGKIGPRVRVETSDNRV